MFLCIQDLLIGQLLDEKVFPGTLLRFSKYNEPETREDNFGTKEILGRRE